MIKVRMLKTGEIKSVTKNVAHGLIELGAAVLYKERMLTPGDKKISGTKKSTKREVYKTK